MPKQNHIGDYTPVLSLFNLFFREEITAQAGKFCHSLTCQVVADFAHPPLDAQWGAVEKMVPNNNHIEKQWLRRSSSRTQLCAETFQAMARKKGEESCGKNGA